MLSQQPNTQNIDLWQSFVTIELGYIQSRQEFINSCTDRVAMLQQALQNSR